MKYFLLIFFSLLHTFISAINIETSPSLEYRNQLPSNTFHKFCRSIYTAGEEGLLLQLLKELNISQGTFCDVGASDGIDSSNTYYLIKNHNFSGLSIEADSHKASQCRKHYTGFPQVQIMEGYVLYDDENNDLNAWLKRSNLPLDFDILSIDIDGDDYYVWQKLHTYRPKIVVFEVNSFREPIFHEMNGRPSAEDEVHILKKVHPSRVAFGCSFITGVELGLEKGYIPVAYTGNLIFVRKDLVDQLHEFPYKISNDPYDYLDVFSYIHLIRNKWFTNNCLIYCAAVRDYYVHFKSKKINLVWVQNRMNEIMLQLN